jgi:hypothetical protein
VSLELSYGGVMSEMHESMFDGLSSEGRERLIAILELRELQLQYQVELNRMMIDQARNPTAHGDRIIGEYKRMRLNPIEDKIAEQSMGLVAEAIDIEGIKSLLPMFVASIMQKVNLPLVLALTGASPERAAAIKSFLEDLYRKGME